MSEELHEITYAPTIIDRLTRDEIEEAANLEVMDYFSSVMRAKVLACREWLANNPQGMIRDEFDALPDGTVLEVYNSQSVKVGNRGAYTDSDRKVGWVQITDHDLLRLSVVSTPPAPTLDAVREAATVVEDRHDQRLPMLNAEQIRHGARLNVHTDWLNRIDADITALEAHHSDTEHAGGDVDPSEAHLQPNDRERPAGVVYDAVSETAENHLPTQPKEQTMKTITVDGVESMMLGYLAGPPVRIVILQRGWVVVGYWQRDGEDVTITSGKVIRKWGTTAGLGELVSGPTDDTVLDPAGTVRAHILGVVATLDADTEAWSEVL